MVPIYKILENRKLINRKLSSRLENGKEAQKTQYSTQFYFIKVYDANYGEVNGYHKDVLVKGLGF
jgi:hypothetical protein